MTIDIAWNTLEQKQGIKREWVERIMHEKLLKLQENEEEQTKHFIQHRKKEIYEDEENIFKKSANDWDFSKDVHRLKKNNNKKKDFLQILPDIKIGEGNIPRVCLASPNLHIISESFIQAGSKFLDHHKYKSALDKCNIYVGNVDREGLEVPSNLILNSLGFRFCLSGSKSEQLRCRNWLTTKHGCDLSTFNFEPKTFDMNQINECIKLREYVQKNNKLWWLKKPTSENVGHGRGQQIFDNKKMQSYVKDKLSCTKAIESIFTVYIHQPILLSKHKFDVRTFLLISRARDPTLAFYHGGYARVSNYHYKPSDTRKMAHFTNLKSQKKKKHQW